jgi:hypothetical protein
MAASRHAGLGAASLGRLHSEPRRVRPPHDVRDPGRQQDFCAETTDEWRVRLYLDNLRALEEPLSGLELGNHDCGILNWLAGWAVPTIGTATSLPHRARAARSVEVSGGGA